MRKKVTVTRGACVLIAAAIAGTGVQARAGTPQGPCEVDSVFPNRVYIAGSSAFEAVLAGLAGFGTFLSSKGIPISILYEPRESCLALNDLLLGQASTEVPVTDPPLDEPVGPIFYGMLQNNTTVNPPVFTSEGDTCQPASPPPLIDIAVSDVFYDTCVADGPMASVGSQRETLGPIQAMTFAAPILSTATAISAEAAYVVFGYDAASYVVEPWDQPSGIFVRPATSGVEAMIGAAIGLPTPLWQNAPVPAPGALTCATGEAASDGCLPQQQEGTAPFMQSALANVSAEASETIGILSAQEVNKYNSASTANKLKILAYQHAGQPCGYLPDSTVSAKDKLNVRQGRYAVWGPLHLFFNVDGRGNPLPGDGRATETGKIAAMTAILNYFIATGPSPNQTFHVPGPLDGPPSEDGGVGDGGVPPAVGDGDKTVLAAAEISASFVPWCAMQVIRASELGPEASYEPKEPCTCFYANSVGAAMPDYCAPCTASLDCAAPYPTCRLGYCEVQ